MSGASVSAASSAKASRTRLRSGSRSLEPEVTARAADTYLLADPRRPPNGGVVSPGELADEREESVRHAGERGDDDDGHLAQVGMAADLLDHGQAAPARHHHVE